MRHRRERRSTLPRGAVLISGGGTAGHLVPGIAIARALVAQGWSIERVHFVGTRRELDARLVPDAGFALTQLPGRGLAASDRASKATASGPPKAKKKGARRHVIGNVGAVAELAWGVGRGIWLVGRRRPAAVLSLGGYGALPAAVGAIIWRVPLVLTEQNAASSATNRLLSRFARAASVPAPHSGLRHEVVTGMPVRPEVVRAASEATTKGGRASLRERRGWPTEVPVVVVFGGSLGARRINTALWQALLREPLRQRLTERKLIIHHVVGERDWPLLEGDLDKALAGYCPVVYDDDLATVLATADLAICRAGGSTVAELVVTGTPAVLVPYPHAPNDHQRRNAEVLVAAGASVIIDDEDLTAERLAAELERALISSQPRQLDPSQQPDTSRKPSEASGAPGFGSVDAADAVASLLTQHSRPRARRATGGARG